MSEAQGRGVGLYPRIERQKTQQAEAGIVIRRYIKIYVEMMSL